MSVTERPGLRDTTSTHTTGDHTTAPTGAHRPSLGWYLTEPARGLLALGALPFATPWLRRAPRGDGHGVLVLPGLLADDSSTRALRVFLSGLGYTVRGWGLGRNLGPTDSVLDGMPRALRELAAETSGPASVIGWSLGGIYARELAREHTGLIRQVITLGSPFALVDAWQSRADGAFRRRHRLHADPGRLPSREQLSRPIPVPSTAVYSRSDGIVDWRACIAAPAATYKNDATHENMTHENMTHDNVTHENIEVRCGHLGFGVDAATLWAVADRLAQRPGDWRPFRPPAGGRAWFPGAR